MYRGNEIWKLLCGYLRIYICRFIQMQLTELIEPVWIKREKRSMYTICNVY